MVIYLKAKGMKIIYKYKTMRSVFRIKKFEQPQIENKYRKNRMEKSEFFQCSKKSISPRFTVS